MNRSEGRKKRSRTARQKSEAPHSESDPGRTGPGNERQGPEAAPADLGHASLGVLGEFGLIRALVHELGETAADVLLPVGDDAALWQPEGPILATTDALVEGVHFRADWGEAGDLGYKAISVNVSDIAAMGGSPNLALLALGVTAATEPTWLGGLYRGMAKACRQYGMKVAGGDTFISEQVTLALTVLGTPSPGGAVLRAGAREGDLLLVTGALGDAAAGLAYLKARQLEGRLKGKTRKSDRGAAAARMAPALNRFLRPEARVQEGMAAASAGASAMIDISDGLAGDAVHLASASGVGVRIRASSVPVGSGAKSAERLLGIVPERLALSGGEDYELLIAVHPDRADGLIAAIESIGTPLTVVGEVLPAGEGCFLEGGEKRIPLKEIGGFDHFKSS